MMAILSFLGCFLEQTNALQMPTEQWDDFEIYLDEVIGKGGMGTVYRGRQISLDRTVAIKVLNEDLLEDDQFIKRFQREGMVMGKLSNPHIVQVLGAGEKGRQYYIAMEYLEGTTLEELLKQDETFTYRQIVNVGLSVAKAIETAWEHDIVHRDIKPDNIFLENGEHVKVMDYGLARTEETGLTRAGTAMGTYQYMSIEQMEGEAVDVRTDIYSLGLVLYQMLTGIIPGSGGSATEIYKNRTESEPPPPGKMSSDIPAELENLIMDCVKREPSQRPSDPGQLVSRLKDVLHGGAEQLDQDVDMHTVVDDESVGSGSTTLEQITSEIRTRIPNTVSGSILLTCALIVLVGTGMLAWFGPSSFRTSFWRGNEVDEADNRPALYFPSKTLDENVNIGRVALVKNNFGDAKPILESALEYARSKQSPRVDEIKTLLDRTRYKQVKEKALRKEQEGNWSEAISLWKRARQFQTTSESKQKLKELEQRKTHRLLSFSSKSLGENIEIAREAKVKGNLEDAEDILQNALVFARRARPSQTERIKTELDRLRYERHRKKAVEAEKKSNLKEALSHWETAAEFRTTEESEQNTKRLKRQLARNRWKRAVEQLDWTQLLTTAGQLVSLYPGQEKYKRRQRLARDVQKALEANENKRWKNALALLQKWTGAARIDRRLKERVNDLADEVQQSLNAEIKTLTNRANIAFSRQDWSTYLRLLDELSGLTDELDKSLQEKRQLAKWGNQTPNGMVFFPGTKYLGDTAPREIRNIRAFYIDRTEVTVKEYSSFLDDVKNENHSCPMDELKLSNGEREQLSGKDHTPLLWEETQTTHPDRPVTGVDWYDAFCYARWSNKRLPRAPEWKAVALYNVTSNNVQTYPWGDTFNARVVVRDRIISVRELPQQGASPYGAVGMAGNVEEWTRSVRGSEGPSLPSSNTDQVIVQGAGFMEGSSESNRTSTGVGHTPLYRSITTGFRCVKYPSQQ